MENKTVKYLAVVCYGIMAIWDVVNLIDSFSVWGLLSAVGIALVVIALLVSVPALSALGFALNVVVPLRSCVQFFDIMKSGYLTLSKWLFLVWIAAAIAYFLLMIASINIKSAKTLCTLATIFAIIRLVALMVRNITEGYGVTFSPVLWGLLMAIGAMLLGLTYDGIAQKKATSKVAIPTNSPVQTVIEDSNVDKLMQLKAFLDDGVITQEEFDAKKKQLLGL